MRTQAVAVETEGSFEGVLTQKLQQLYRSQDTLPKLIDDDAVLAQRLDDYYINLQVLLGENESSTYDQVGGMQSAIAMEHLFAKIDDAHPAVKKVLLLGGAGVGKTTLLHCIAYRWGCHQLFNQQFDYVFKLRLKNLLNEDWRDLYDGKELRKNPLACFIHSCLHLQDSTVGIELDAIIQIADKAKVLLLLDGYDEIAHLANDVNRMAHQIMQQVFIYPYVVMASRPNALSVDMEGRFERKIENKGLDAVGIEQYLTIHFKNSPDLWHSFQAFLETHVVVKQLCSIPVNAAILCLVWSDENVRKAFSDVFHVTDLYQAVILWLGRRYLTKFKGMMNENLYDECVQACLELKFLRTVAYEGFLSGQLMIDKKLLGPTLSHADYADLTITDIHRYGLLRSEGDGRNLINQNYYFVHLTFQEYLIACYLNAQLQSSDMAIVQSAMRTIAEHRDEPRYLVTLKFLCELVMYDESDQKTLLITRFWEAVSCNRDGVLELSVDSKIMLWMHLLGLTGIDARIPNVDALEFLVDEVVLQNMAQWTNIILESRYLSTRMADALKVWIKQAITRPFSEIRRAVITATEIFSTLIYVPALSDKVAVFTAVMPLLSVSDWRIQQLGLQTLQRIQVGVRLSATVVEDCLWRLIPLLIPHQTHQDALRLLKSLIESVPPANADTGATLLIYTQLANTLTLCLAHPEFFVVQHAMEGLVSMLPQLPQVSESLLKTMVDVLEAAQWGKARGNTDVVAWMARCLTDVFLKKVSVLSRSVESVKAMLESVFGQHHYLLTALMHLLPVTAALTAWKQFLTNLKDETRIRDLCRQQVFELMRTQPFRMGWDALQSVLCQKKRWDFIEFCVLESLVDVLNGQLSNETDRLYCIDQVCVVFNSLLAAENVLHVHYNHHQLAIQSRCAVALMQWRPADAQFALYLAQLVLSHPESAWKNICPAVLTVLSPDVWITALRIRLESQNRTVKGTAPKAAVWIIENLPILSFWACLFEPLLATEVTAAVSAPRHVELYKPSTLFETVLPVVCRYLSAEQVMPLLTPLLNLTYWPDFHRIASEGFLVYLLADETIVSETLAMQGLAAVEVALRNQPKAWSTVGPALQRLMTKVSTQATAFVSGALALFKAYEPGYPIAATECKNTVAQPSMVPVVTQTATTLVPKPTVAAFEALLTGDSLNVANILQSLEMARTLVPTRLSLDRLQVLFTHALEHVDCSQLLIEESEWTRRQRAAQEAAACFHQVGQKLLELVDTYPQNTQFVMWVEAQHQRLDRVFDQHDHSLQQAQRVAEKKQERIDMEQYLQAKREQAAYGGERANEYAPGPELPRREEVVYKSNYSGQLKYAFNVLVVKHMLFDASRRAVASEKLLTYLVEIVKRGNCMPNEDLLQAIVAYVQYESFEKAVDVLEQLGAYPAQFRLPTKSPQRVYKTVAESVLKKLSTLSIVDQLSQIQRLLAFVEQKKSVFMLDVLIKPLLSQAATTMELAIPLMTQLIAIFKVWFSACSSKSELLEILPSLRESLTGMTFEITDTLYGALLQLLRVVLADTDSAIRALAHETLLVYLRALSGHTIFRLGLLKEEGIPEMREAAFMVLGIEKLEPMLDQGVTDYVLLEVSLQILNGDMQDVAITLRVHQAARRVLYRCVEGMTRTDERLQWLNQHYTDLLALLGESRGFLKAVCHRILDSGCLTEAGTLFVIRSIAAGFTFKITRDGKMILDNQGYQLTGERNKTALTQIVQAILMQSPHKAAIYHRWVAQYVDHEPLCQNSRSGLLMAASDLKAVKSLVGPLLVTHDQWLISWLYAEDRELWVLETRDYFGDRVIHTRDQFGIFSEQMTLHPEAATSEWRISVFGEPQERTYVVKTIALTVETYMQWKAQLPFSGKTYFDAVEAVTLTQWDLLAMKPDQVALLTRTI